MKKQNRYGLIWLAVWVLGALAAFLRRGLYIGALDAKGLLVRGHPVELALWAVVALGAGLVALTVRKLDGTHGTHPCTSSEPLCWSGTVRRYGIPRFRRAPYPHNN